MTNRKRPVEIWPIRSIQGTPRGTYIAGFDMPDGTMLYVEHTTDEEYRAAQFKARATARAIVRTQNPQAFAGLKA